MKNMFSYGSFLLLAAWVFAFATIAAADEGAEGGEAAKHKPQPKPTPDSAVSVILDLPEVKAWQNWMDGKGYTLEAWGESIRRIETDPCWEVAVAEKTGSGDDDIRPWIYFCVNRYSKDVTVEKEDKATGETIFMPYDSWKKNCHPLSNSPGKC